MGTRRATVIALLLDSEVVVQSGHSCQANPHTIAEIRRILLMHLRGA